jgi:hypothetical protein
VLSGYIFNIVGFRWHEKIKEKRKEKKREKREKETEHIIWRSRS